MNNVLRQSARSRRLQILLGGVFVAAAIVLHLRIMGPAIMALNVGLIFAFLVWAFEKYEDKPGPDRVLPYYLIGIAIQCLHFYEEYLTGFQREFPNLLFGYTWSDQLYVGFNLIWLFLFILAAWGVLHQVRLAYLIVWFYAIIAGIANGIAHPVFSLINGSYFPGLITSPLLLVTGILIIKELMKARQATNVSPPAI